MPPIARGQPLPVSTVPNTLYLIVTIEDSMEKKSSSVSKAMGMLPPCNLPAASIVVVQYSGYLRY